MPASPVDIQTPRHKAIKWAAAGRLSNDPTYSGIWGERKAATLTWDPVVRVSAEGREFVDAYIAKMPLEIWQTDFTTFFQAYLLSFAPHQVFVEEANGNWWNFTQNTGDFGAQANVNGAELMAYEMTFEATDKEQALKLEYSTKMHPFCYVWQQQNNATISAGTTGGGIVSGLTPTTYNPALYGIPGIRNVLWNSYQIPANCITSPKFTVKFAKMETNILEQPITRYAEVDFEYNMLASLVAELTQLESIRNVDHTVTANLWNGLQLVTVNSASTNGGTNLGDDKTFIKIKHKGKIPYDVPGTQSNIVWTPGTGTGGTVTFNLIGYAP